MMRQLLLPFRLLYFIYAVTVFVVLMIPVFLWSLLMLTAGKVRGANLIYKGCMVWADVWLALIFIRHRNLYEQPLQPGRSYLFVANHISYLDAAIIPKVFRHPLRPLGKVEMTKIPVFGFIYKKVIVSVDRSSAEARAKSVRELKWILGKGISILVFPEGTFNTTHRPLKEFYDGAFRIAIETGTPVKPVLFLDTYSRMNYKSIFSLNPGPNRSVFLEEVETEGLTLKDVDYLRDKVYGAMEKKLLQYGAAWSPLLEKGRG